MPERQPSRALITGASSGIGAAFARKFACLGYNLLLVARRGDRLSRLAQEIQDTYGVKALILVADLSSSDGIREVEKHIHQLGDVMTLVNNAGFGIPGRFADFPLQTHLDMIQVHVIASVHLTWAVLPAMIDRKQGAIINVASLAGLIPMASSVTYAATKAYLVAFSQSLHHQLRGSGIRIQALCPGFTHSEFHDRPEYQRRQFKERMPRFLWMSAEQVVEGSLRCLPRGRVVCVPGTVNRIIAALARTGIVELLWGLVWRRFRR